MRSHVGPDLFEHVVQRREFQEKNFVQPISGMVCAVKQEWQSFGTGRPSAQFGILAFGEQTCRIGHAIIPSPAFKDVQKVFKFQRTESHYANQPRVGIEDRPNARQSVQSFCALHVRIHRCVAGGGKKSFGPGCFGLMWATVRGG